MNDYWIKTLDEAISYLEYHPIAKDRRNTWRSYRHNHAVNEVHIILQGHCKIEFEEKVVTVQAGQALFIRPGVFHCSTEISKPFLRLSLTFLPSDKLDLWQNTSAETSHFLFHVSPAILQICQDIYDESDREDSCLGQEMTSALLLLLLISLLRMFQQKHISTASASITDYHTYQTIDAFFSIPIMDFEKDWSRKTLAKSLHCSERQIDRLIPNLYGMTFQQKRTQARMDYAKYLLRNTDKKISEICTLVGYANAAPFNKAFKANCGMTPQEFRRNCEKP